MLLAVSALVAAVSAWTMRGRPAHERAIVLTLFAVVLLGFAMGGLVLFLTDTP